MSKRLSLFDTETVENLLFLFCFVSTESLRKCVRQCIGCFAGTETGSCQRSSKEAPTYTSRENNMAPG